jgi:hypothetical protein
MRLSFLTHRWIHLTIPKSLYRSTCPLMERKAILKVFEGWIVKACFAGYNIRDECVLGAN